MDSKRPGYIDVDALASEPDAGQLVVQHFGVSADAMKLTGTELRTPCFLQCGKESLRLAAPEPQADARVEWAE